MHARSPAARRCRSPDDLGRRRTTGRSDRRAPARLNGRTSPGLDARSSENGLAEADAAGTRPLTLPAGRPAEPARGQRPGSLHERTGRLRRRASHGSNRADEATAENEPASNRDEAERLLPEASKVGTVRIKTPLLEQRTRRRPSTSPRRTPTRSARRSCCTSSPKTRVSGVRRQARRRSRDSTPRPARSLDLREHAAAALRRTRTRTVRRPARLARDARRVRHLRQRRPRSRRGRATAASRARLGRTASFAITAGAAAATPLRRARCRSPRLRGGRDEHQAGAFTPLHARRITPPDADQALTGVTMHLPAGHRGDALARRRPCPEPQASARHVRPESLIGIDRRRRPRRATRSPSTGGHVYITGPYNGAPFGLSS